MIAFPLAKCYCNIMKNPNSIAYFVFHGTVCRLPEQVHTLGGKALPVWEMSLSIVQAGAWNAATRTRGADEPVPITLRVRQGVPLQYAQAVQTGDRVQATGRVYMRRRQDARGDAWYTPEFYLDAMTLVLPDGAVKPAAPAGASLPHDEAEDIQF